MAYVRRYAFYSLDRKYNPFYYYADVQLDGKAYNLLSYNDGSPNAVPGVVTGSEYLALVLTEAADQIFYTLNILSPFLHMDLLTT